MMLPTQIGDRTDEVTQGEGCGGTATAILEPVTYFIYWVQSVVSWLI